jgi:glyoxylase-like metal-dependent hydrolase (beta-lactamase superfamily II)
MIEPTSQQEFNAHRDRGVPASEEVAPGIWSLPLANKPGHMPFTFSYAVQDAGGRMHLVDSGWDLEGNARAVEEHFRRHGIKEGPASITITHLHPDHLGLAERLRAQFGTGIAMHRIEQQSQLAYAQWNRDGDLIRPDLEAWGVPAERFEQVLGYAMGTPRVVVDADVLLQDGDLLDIPGRKLRVLHTPGHTPGHICLLEEQEQLLFSGDHLLPKVAPGIGPGIDAASNPLARYLESLARVAGIDVRQCLPGHEYRFQGIGERARAIASRHLQRTVEVVQVLAGEPEADAWTVASRLSWGRGWEALDRHYLVSALRQTAMHMQLVRSGSHLKSMEAWNRA